MKKLIMDDRNSSDLEIENLRVLAKMLSFEGEGGDSSALRLLKEIHHLRLRKGFVLRASERKDFYGALNIIWALPVEFADEKETEDIPFAEIRRPLPENADFTDAFDLCEEFIVKKPKHGMNIMEAVDGDHTPVSYLLASVFAREVLELGAFWHGIAWGFHTVLTDDPWKMEWDEDRYENVPSEEEEWKFLEKRPDTWAPVVSLDKDEVVVRFRTYTAMGMETIYEFADTYREGSYAFEWNIRKIAEGRGGFLV